MRHFCCEKVAFFKYFGLHLDLELTFENILDGSWTWTEFKQDWIWIAKYDSLLISAAEIMGAGVESNRRLRFFLESEPNAESEF